MKYNLDFFIYSYNIRPADAIVVKKEFFGIVDHYVIYLGCHNGEHKFIANSTQGIQILPVQKILQWLKTYLPVDVNRFMGNEFQRNQAIRRALSRLNENAYNFILNNCEHFKNYVQLGISKSFQVENVGKGLLVAGTVTTLVGAFRKSNKAVGLGLLALTLGAIAVNLNEKK